MSLLHQMLSLSPPAALQLAAGQRSLLHGTSSLQLFAWVPLGNQQGDAGDPELLRRALPPALGRLAAVPRAHSPAPPAGPTAGRDARPPLLAVPWLPPACPGR